MTQPELSTTDFKTAYQLAAQNEGKIVNFDGILPSGIPAVQQIVKVPAGKNPRAFVEAVEGRKSTSSDNVKGTHVVGTTKFNGQTVDGWHI